LGTDTIGMDHAANDYGIPYVDPRTGKPSTEHQSGVPRIITPAKVIPPTQAEIEQAERQANLYGLCKREMAERGLHDPRDAQTSSEAVSPSRNWPSARRPGVTGF